MKKYFAMIDGEKRGPFTLSELMEQGVHPDTYIWCKGMADWEHARDNADVCRAYRRRLMGAPVDDSPLGNGASYDGPLKDDPDGENPFMAPPRDMSVPPRSLLVPAILSAIFCFAITGIVAVYFAVQVSRKWGAGEREEAYDCDRKARMWIGITFFFGIAFTATLQFLLPRLT